MSQYQDWGELFYNVSPYSWAYMGIAIALGTSVIGAAWYTHTLMQGHLHRRSQHPRSRSQGTPHPLQKSGQVCDHPLSVIFCEAVAIYGVIMAIILQGKINESKCGDNYAECAFSGYALFWTGISVGFSNLFCGYFPPQL